MLKVSFDGGITYQEMNGNIKFIYELAEDELHINVTEEGIIYDYIEDGNVVGSMGNTFEELSSKLFY